MTTQMYTYSIHRTSGETFAVEWDGDTLHAVCGPLDADDRAEAIRDIRSAADWDYGYSDGWDQDELDAFDADLGWTLASYDPNDGTVYYDRQSEIVLDALGEL